MNPEPMALATGFDFATVQRRTLFPINMSLTMIVMNVTLLCVSSLGDDLAVLASPSPPPSVIKAEADRIQAIAKASRSTVGVFGLDGQGGGSGVVISPDGYVLTNYHVSDPFGNRMRIGLSNGEMHEAVIVGIDPTGDLALLKMDGRDDFPAATIIDSDTVRVGQWCFASGNPFVLATNLQPTTTWGIVSGVHRYQYPSGTILEYTDCIQTDAAINPGNSGGPLYNWNGDLIGINGRGSFEKRGRVNVGVGYAISINQAMLFLGHLKSGRVVDHATLGFTVASDEKGRVIVSNILESSDAYRRGLRYGDEILALAGRDVTSVNQLKNILGIFPSLTRLKLRFKNAEGTVDTYVRLGSLHTVAELDEIITGKPLDGPPTPDGKPPEKKKPDNKKPEDKKPGDKDNPDDSDAEESAEESIGEQSKPKELVDPMKDLFEARRGFGNYYFNRREVDRVTFAKETEFGTLAPSDARWPKNLKWEWSGSVAGESTQFQFTSQSNQLSLTLGSDTSMIDPVRGWASIIDTQGLSGPALAIELWQRWNSIGPRAMGECTYVGTAPVIGLDAWQDLTQVTTGEVESFFYTSPETKKIVLIEIQSDSRQDRLEVYFDDYETTLIEGLKTSSGEVLSKPIPKRIRSSYGITTPMVIDFKRLNVSQETETK
ncbi:MAG: trypsin-like peptidase domain-containing protein [Planctomycetota bacterium]|nr:trypsin-like peptidase domain-containing protein [Planctomycetota bacterium]